MNDKLKRALYEDAQTNGLNAKEYLEVVEKVNIVLNDAALSSLEAQLRITPKDYDINGKEISDE